MKVRPVPAAALFCGMLAAAAFAAGTTDSSGASAALDAGSEICATLDRTVDAGITKLGTEVTAKVVRNLEVAGKVVVPKGTKLVGRVTRAEVRKSRGSAGGISASEFVVVFDRAELRDGTKLTFNGEVVGVGAPRSSNRGVNVGGNATDRMTRGVEPGGGGLLGGISGRPGTATRQTSERASDTVDEEQGDKTARSAGAQGGFDGKGELMAGSRGVFGLEDLELAASADGNVAGDVLLSREQNVRLERGTQLLVVAGEAASGSTS